MIHKNRYTTVLTDRLPEGQSGKFKIVKTVIPKGTDIRTYSPLGYCYHDTFAGNFPTVKLTEESGNDEPDTIWMSDTPFEQEGARFASIVAKGDILIVGLGIGLLPVMIKARNKMVKTITIIEREQDVVNLVFRHIKTRKTRVVVADAESYLYTTDDRYDFIYVDIWEAFITPLKVGELWTAIASRCLNEGGSVRWWMQELHERVRGKLPTKPVEQQDFPGYHKPCLICGKALRFDYAGLCGDCADTLEVSELFIEKE